MISLKRNRYHYKLRQSNVSHSSTAGIQVKMPSKEEQEEIIDKAQKYIDSISSLKQAILDKYLK